MAAMVTVGDILELPELAGARLVAGHDGLTRSVEKVDVVAARETLRHARHGLLLLASGSTLTDDPATLVTLLPRLADAGVAGLAVKPPGWVATVPAQALEVADRLAFPLVELPEATPLNDVDDAVLRVLLDHQEARLRRAAEIHERFTAVALSGGRTRDVVLTLQQLLDRPVAVVDPDGVVIAAEPPQAWTGSGADDGRVEHPIRAGEEGFGTILVRPGPDGLDEEGGIAVERAGVAIALRQVQARAVAEAHEGFAAVSLEELISGQVTDADTLAERAATFGWDLEPGRAVLVVTCGETARGPAEPELRVLAAAARQSLRPNAIVWIRSRSVAALIVPPSDAPSDRRRLAEALQREAVARLGPVPVSVGVGRTVKDPLELPGSFREAQLALEAGTWEEGPGTARTFEDVGVERLLAASPPADLKDFVTTTLGPLLDYDRDQGGELVPTLSAWLETRSVAETARRVYAHYNTVRKRLERIEELLGPVLTDARRALDLAVALRLHERSGPPEG
ncbi:MAG TPA: PucR family transcriptional regulator ligand-binding domain-containing protein [Acidimicrobiia bacterium]|nr:PucR family transcriptional regulator ligand-binding domain-containing protein [Acidimicrobiia bacterium]